MKKGKVKKGKAFTRRDSAVVSAAVNGVASNRVFTDLKIVLLEADLYTVLTSIT